MQQLALHGGSQHPAWFVEGRKAVLDGGRQLYAGICTVAGIFGDTVGREWIRACNWAGALSRGEATLYGVLLFILLFYSPLFLLGVPPYA